MVPISSERSNKCQRKSRKVHQNLPTAIITAGHDEKHNLIHLIWQYKATFWCKGTLEQIKALGDYMRANNIEFGKVAK